MDSPDLKFVPADEWIPRVDEYGSRAKIPENYRIKPHTSPESCKHICPVFDVRNRTVQCESCGLFLDAFDVMVNLSRYDVQRHNLLKTATLFQKERDEFYSERNQEIRRKAIMQQAKYYDRLRNVGVEIIEEGNGSCIFKYPENWRGVREAEKIKKGIS